MRLRRTPTTDAAHGWRRFRTAALRTEVLVRAFYAFFPFWIATHLDGLAPLWNPPPGDWLWPVMWLDGVGPEVGAPILLIGFALSALLACLWPERRWVRGLLALTLFEVLALSFSFGKIHHLMHGWLFTAVIFAVFLPDAALAPARASRRDRVLALRAVGAAQAMLALTYSLAGVGKLLGSLYQLGLGQTSPLHPSALAIHIADRLLQTQPSTTLGPWMIAHGTWMWPAMLATLYLQTFAVVAVLRPRLHRLWAVGLIGFHLVTGLSLTIDFTPNILLLGLLGLGSPFAPSPVGWQAMLADLPGVGRLFRPGARHARATTIGAQPGR